MKANPSTRSRRAERTENAVFGGLAATMMGASPVVAYVAGRWAEAHLSQAARVQQAPLRQVTATLLRDVPGRRQRGRDVRGISAQWLGPDGVLRTGPVSAPAGTKAGSRVKIWTDQAGEVAGAPMQRESIASRVVMAQGLAAAGFPVGVGAIGWLVVRGLERHRLSA